MGLATHKQQLTNVKRRKTKQKKRNTETDGRTHTTLLYHSPNTRTPVTSSMVANLSKKGMRSSNSRSSLSSNQDVHPIALLGWKIYLYTREDGRRRNKRREERQETERDRQSTRVNTPSRQQGRDGAREVLPTATLHVDKWRSIHFFLGRVGRVVDVLTLKNIIIKNKK